MAELKFDLEVQQKEISNAPKVFYWYESQLYFKASLFMIGVSKYMRLRYIT